MGKLTYRRIDRVHYPLSADQLEKLKAVPKSDVFTVGFLRGFPKLCGELTNRHLASYCNHLSGSLRKYKTFGEILDLPYWEIQQKVSTHWVRRPSALIFFEDMMTAFGIDLEGAPPLPYVDSNGNSRAITLAKEIAKSFE